MCLHRTSKGNYFNAVFPAKKYTILRLGELVTGWVNEQQQRTESKKDYLHWRKLSTKAKPYTKANVKDLAQRLLLAALAEDLNLE